MQLPCARTAVRAQPQRLPSESQQQYRVQVAPTACSSSSPVLTSPWRHSCKKELAPHSRWRASGGRGRRSSTGSSSSSACSCRAAARSGSMGGTRSTLQSLMQKAEEDVMADGELAREYQMHNKALGHQAQQQLQGGDVGPAPAAPSASPAADPAAPLFRLTMPQLKAMCKELGLAQRGSKADLVQRILTKQSAAVPPTALSAAAEPNSISTASASTAANSGSSATREPATEAGMGPDVSPSGRPNRALSAEQTGPGQVKADDQDLRTAELEAVLMKNTVDQLKEQCRQRGLTMAGTKAHIVERLLKNMQEPPREVSEFEQTLLKETVDQLRERCRGLGLSMSGYKMELIKRLLWKLVEQPRSMGPVPTREQLMAESVVRLKERCKEHGIPVGGKKPQIIKRLLDVFAQFGNSGAHASSSAANATSAQQSSRLRLDYSPLRGQSAAEQTDESTADRQDNTAPGLPSDADPSALSSPSPSPPPASPFRGVPVPVIFTDHRKKRRIMVKQGQHPEDIATEVVKGLTSRFSSSTVLVARGLNATVLALRALASASAQMSEKGFLLGFQHWHLPDTPENEERNFAFVLYKIERFKLPVKESFKVARATYPPKLAAFLSRKLLDFETPAYTLEIRSALALIRALEGCLITRKIMHRPFKDLLLFVRVQPDHMPRSSNDMGKYVMQLLAVKVQRAKPTALSAYRWESDRLQELQEDALAEVPLPVPDAQNEGEEDMMAEELERQLNDERTEGIVLG